MRSSSTLKNRKTSVDNAFGIPRAESTTHMRSKTSKLDLKAAYLKGLKFGLETRRLSERKYS